VQGAGFSAGLKKEPEFGKEISHLTDAGKLGFGKERSPI